MRLRNTLELALDAAHTAAVALMTRRQVHVPMLTIPIRIIALNVLWCNSREWLCGVERHVPEWEYPWLFAFADLMWSLNQAFVLTIHIPARAGTACVALVRISPN